ncbi:UDP-N-acetylglucosamine 2-epimerase (non-hydrolyzing) [Phenylobacterium sp.]|uniref:non-hydrolyzing UDP-N-acetylglucosamine 2-epimerase n=1 Tax=Phenylobacterium sp. TaxID=1871053 RepID=UPI0030F38A9F
MSARILLVFGTRPEAIKMLPVVKALRARASLEILVAVTGQHREMLDQVFAAFDERPDIDLELMSPGQTLTDITVRVLGRMAEVFAEHRPDLVLVHGDTTTAMAAALAAFYARIPVGHVEAGLRSHDINRPWPEEYNRVSVDAVADFCFAPTPTSAENLRRESPRERTIAVTGNTGIDALLYMAGIVDEAVLQTLDVVPAPDKRLVLVTGHRRESFGDGFDRICDGIARIAGREDVEVIYPVHLNPQVKDVVMKRLSGRSNVHLIAPVDYSRMVALMKRADVILTDSGGIQEEGPALGKPVLVMREVTERPEALSTGVVSLVGTDPDLICREVFRLLDDRDYYASRARAVFPYGDGTAAEKIADIIETYARTMRAA